MKIQTAAPFNATRFENVEAGTVVNPVGLPYGLLMICREMTNGPRETNTLNGSVTVFGVRLDDGRRINIPPGTMVHPVPGTFVCGSE